MRDGEWIRVAGGLSGWDPKVAVGSPGAAPRRSVSPSGQPAEEIELGRRLSRSAGGVPSCATAPFDKRIAPP